MKISKCTTNKPVYCFSHWCKIKKLQYRKSMWNHEDSHIGNPEFIRIIRKLNHLQNNHQRRNNVELYSKGVDVKIV